MSKHEYLRAKVRVGSVHGKLHYNSGERVFHHDDVPKHIRDNVESVQWLKATKCIKDSADPRFQPEWNSSTLTSKQERDHTIPQKHESTRKTLTAAQLCLTTTISRAKFSNKRLLSPAPLFGTTNMNSKNNMLSNFNSNNSSQMNFSKMNMKSFQSIDHNNQFFSTTDANNANMNFENDINLSNKIWGTCDTRDFQTYGDLADLHQQHTGQPRWNNATQINPKMWIIDSDTNTSRLQESNGKKSNRIKLTNYKTPYQREKEFMDKKRQEKEEHRQSIIEEAKLKQIESHMAYDYKTRSKLHRRTLGIGDINDFNSTLEQSNLQAIDKKLKNTYNLDSLTEFLSKQKSEKESKLAKRMIEKMMSKHNKMFTTRQLLRMQERKKYDIVRTYFHNGVFQYNDAEKQRVWSCCMNANLHSQGCQARFRNVAGWQTVGF